MDDAEDINLTGLSPVTLPQRIVVPERKIDRACVACKWSAEEKPDLVCRFNPPQVTFMAVPEVVMVQGPKGPQRGQGMAVRPFTAFPVVRPDLWCAQFAQK